MTMYIFPSVGCVRVGRMEVVTYTREGERGELKECFHYPITRMRCWKVGYKVLQQLYGARHQPHSYAPLCVKM